jgi:5-oxoprolinase (ATP-hydrolysing)
LHADLFPAHERQLAALTAELGFANVSCSSEVAPLPKLVDRAETTVVDAYLRPVLRDYLAQLQASLPGSSILLMTSAGGLVSPEEFRGHESVLSGPAGGLVGYAQVAAAVGLKRAIGLDMGGTSTDVSRWDGHDAFQYESRKAGVRLIAPTLAIETVAAGGGSICKFDGTQLTVGPQSAGADPGPACYGRGGPLTVTDLNFYLGRIATEDFPFALHRRPVEQQLRALAQAVTTATGERLAPTELATGLLEIANASMARAVRSISVAQGSDPADYALVAFGGAAAQHACAVAEELGIRQIVNHPEAGILSAYGIAHANVVRHAAVGVTGEPDDSALAAQLEQLAETPRQAVARTGGRPEALKIDYSVDLRYVGTDTALTVPWANQEKRLAHFQALHQQRFGYLHPDRPVELVTLRVQVTGKSDRQAVPSQRVLSREGLPSSCASVYFAGQAVEAPCYQRALLPPGARLVGPALVADPHSTVVLEPGWQAELRSDGTLLLTSEKRARTTAAQAPQAVLLEVFHHLFSGIAEQMGEVLRRTAVSVNVKERLDYSCAVFTASGELVANAPHVPVHLGAMGATVRAILAERPQLAPGDVYLSNDPYRGGSHLPDLTVVTPVHAPGSGELLFFTACRAHHAEIGGIRPGSMPPHSQNLAEEGVLITNFALLEQGTLREQQLRELLASGPSPSRRIEENLSDVRAQVAANQQGAVDLLALVERYSLPVVQAQVAGMHQAAETKVRQALAQLELRSATFTDWLETAAGESIPICVKITLHPDAPGPALTIDFTGTAPAVAGNLNANRAIVTAAVLYVLRLLVDEDLPLNEGALRAVQLVLPEGLLNPTAGVSPELTPAVAAGNVETSQRVVDVLLGALGLAAASQGTMNNLLFGDATLGYYETIAGGSGATAAGPGAAAVQVHMTNTRATDPEILERRLPVRLHAFRIRRGSGGRGRHAGGDGVVRCLEFLAPLEVSLITQRRGPHPPYGIEGGGPGKLGNNVLQRAGGNLVELPGICALDVGPGDRLTLKTPGGGGFGQA